MKITAESTDTIKLTVRTTDKQTKTIKLPRLNIWYWYPFNINFTYRYTFAKDYLYLVKEKGYTGDNLYRADILKRTKPLEHRGGVMFHPQVFQRNMYIIERAKELGIPTIKSVFTLQDVEAGFEKLGDIIQTVRDQIENRFIWDNENAWYVSDTNSEEWDEKVYGQATPLEIKALQEFGEIYTMLSIMRKLVTE